MSVIQNNLLLTAGDAGYNLTRSVRLRASATANLSQTITTSATWALSVWVKRGVLSAISPIFGDGVKFLANDTLTAGSLTTTAVYRDPSNWYHLYVSNLGLYINGVLLGSVTTSALTNPRIGSNGANYFDGELAELNFINGATPAVTAFGSFDAITGVWKSARYSGSYPTGSSYVPFTDNSALTTSSNVGLGKDFSGNGNYWTTNNISLTSGVTYDSMTDVPTLTSATAANYCVLNPLSNGAGTLSAGNLNHVVGGSITRCNSTIFASSGKWYFEVTLNTAGTNTSIGIGQNNITNQYPGQDILSFVQEIDNARKGNNDVYTSYGTALTAGQVFMCAVDLTNLKIFFGGQGSWFASSDPVAGTNPAFTLTAGLYCAISRPFGGSAAISINFGQRPFTYTPPTGFVALNTYNLPTSTIVKGNKVMDATLWTGNGATRSIVNAAGFQPDLVWSKARSAAISHLAYDSVRGATKYLQVNLTSAEGTGADSLTAFNSNGFSLGADTSTTGVNQNGTTYVGWQWQAGQGSTSSNTSGTITSTVSVNASAGFSVVTYTGNGTNGATVGHGLGVKPSLIIEKGRASTYNWVVQGCGVLWPTATQTLFLNSTSGLNAGSGVAAPTSSVFTPAALSYANESGLGYVAYCWTPIAGFSAFGSYSANASADGPFIYTGFRPRWVLLKAITAVSGGDWVLIDTARNPYNVSINWLFPNASTAESNYVNVADILSNGFKIRATWDTINASGATYLYAAFAENPFKNALAR